jgi:hypothetical protein
MQKGISDSASSFCSAPWTYKSEGNSPLDREVAEDAAAALPIPDEDGIADTLLIMTKPFSGCSMLKVAASYPC